MDQQDERRELYRGAGSGYQRAFELAMAPVLIGALGFWLDRWLGTAPILTILFGTVAFAGTVVKLFYQYKAEMEAHDAAAPWSSARAQRSAP